MQRYTIYCTEEQTKKALALGAPITQSQMIDIIRDEIGKHCFLQGSDAYWFPTAEQMLGWLEQNTLFKCIQVSVDAEPANWMYAIYYGKDNCIALDRFSSRKEATLAAIDAALDYLLKTK